MTKYGHKPTGWRQDDKGRAQPPGSFQDLSRDVTDKVLGGTAERSSTTPLRRIIIAVRRHPLSRTTPAPRRERSRDLDGLGALAES